jgi:predicted ATPase
MFKLLYLKLHNHPQLKDLEISFVEEDEIGNVRQPYTTVIIGPNGSGKSFLLRAIGEIFRYHENIKEKSQKRVSWPKYLCHLRYQYKENTYEIVTRQEKTKSQDIRREHIYFKNRHYEKIPLEIIMVEGEENEVGVSIEEVEFPKSLLTSSYLVNDRFIWADSKENDFYQYLGIRNTPNSANTKTFAKKTIRYIIESMRSEGFIDILSNLLDYLGFEKTFQVSYKTRYHKFFFSGEVKEDQIDQFFTKWWESPYTTREQSSVPFTKGKYERLVKDRHEDLLSLIDYLNTISKEEGKLVDIFGSSAKLINIDLFDKSLKIEEFEHVQLLLDLDIISMEKIGIKKKEGDGFSLEDSSSGEYHLILSLLGLYSRIRNNSLILLDEPETSLHPNWQMRYINFLKIMFNKYTSCHFVLATHSHFLVSDLEGDSSAVVALRKDVKTNQITSELLEGKNTYGWSAEEILYNIFKVKTVRNYFYEADLTDLLGLISEGSKNKTEIQRLLESIKSIKITPDDPLNSVIEESEEYLRNI